MRVRPEALRRVPRLAHADALVAALSDQLSQKDKQLAKNADHLGQLIGRLGAFGGAA